MSLFHPYHVVSVSPWPVVSSAAVMGLFTNVFTWIAGVNGHWAVWVSVLSVILCSSLWWRDVVREGTYEGSHTKEVCSGLIIGFVMFILSEVMLFFSMFFSYFSIALSNSLELGLIWPPYGVQVVDWTLVPMSNTVILLSSGVSATFAHYALLSGNLSGVKTGLASTVVMALIFLVMQCSEYYFMSFTMSDSVYGSLFYLMTGFHGVHVFVGMIFLSIMFIRCSLLQVSKERALGFEFSCWYWHFVDVVWLLLFMVLYWWMG